jgi:serine protease Do
LKRGDIVTELNGQPVADADQLRLHISQMAPGTNVKLGIIRDGKPQQVDVTLGELPAEANQKAEPGQQGQGGGLNGVEVQDLTPEVMNQLNLPAGTRGVVVSSVDPSSPAAESGLNRGDVIQEVNHKPVANIQQYRQAVASVGQQPLLLLVNQDGVTRYLVIQPQ